MRAKRVVERGRGTDATDKMLVMTRIIRMVDRTWKTNMFVKVIMKVEVALKRSIAFQTEKATKH